MCTNVNFDKGNILQPLYMCIVCTRRFLNLKNLESCIVFFLILSFCHPQFNSFSNVDSLFSNGTLCMFFDILIEDSIITKYNCSKLISFVCAVTMEKGTELSMKFDLYKDSFKSLAY